MSLCARLVVYHSVLQTQGLIKLSYRQISHQGLGPDSSRKRVQAMANFQQRDPAEDPDTPQSVSVTPGTVLLHRQAGRMHAILRAGGLFSVTHNGPKKQCRQYITQLSIIFKAILRPIS